MEILLFMLIPFIVGIAFGVFVHYRGWRRLCLLPAAPCISTIVVCALLYLLDIGTLVSNPQSRNPYPIYVQALGATALFTPGVILFGFLPAIVGYLLSFVYYTTV